MAKKIGIKGTCFLFHLLLDMDDCDGRNGEERRPREGELGCARHCKDSGKSAKFSEIRGLRFYAWELELRLEINGECLIGY